MLCYCNGTTWNLDRIAECYFSAEEGEPWHQHRMPCMHEKRVAKDGKKTKTNPRKQYMASEEGPSVLE